MNTLSIIWHIFLNASGCQVNDDLGSRLLMYWRCLNSYELGIDDGLLDFSYLAIWVIVRDY